MEEANDEFQRVREVVTKVLLASGWDSDSLRHELTLLVRRREGWMTNLVRDLLLASYGKPNESRLLWFLGESITFRDAFKRSSSLRNCIPTWERVADHLADGLMEVTWSPDSFRAKLRRLTNSRAKWIPKLVDELFRKVAKRPGSAEQLATELNRLRTFHDAYGSSKPLRRLAVVPDQLAMNPAPGAPESWRVPEILTPQALADWFAMPLDQLLRMASKRTSFRASGLRNYRYRWIRKPSARFRLIEAPHPTLKQIQRDIASGILANIPLHSAAHGFHVGRNIKTYTAPHVGKAFVMRMDLQDFFPSITFAQVAAIFRTAGYPEPIVDLLAKLTTHRTPRKVLEKLSDRNAPHESLDLFRQSHLPQGAPSSPALANLASFRLDRRLTGLARKFDATYTRYADDLLFSGDDEFARSSGRFHVFVLATILDEGFLINPRKTHRMRRGVRQRAAGLSLNEKVNTSRRDYEKLKAILYNCARFGPESQNRDGHADFRSHLHGLVQFHALVNPQRGEKLMQAWRQAFP